MKSFSIIIPVKEINDYLRESVPYLLALDYEDFEILILPNLEPSNLESIFLIYYKIACLPFLLKYHHLLYIHP